jgi:site-specific DNA-methyltransferase (adenine-specific)
VKIDAILGINKFKIMLDMGIFNAELRQLISSNSTFLAGQIDKSTLRATDVIEAKRESFGTELGKLFKGDCVELMNSIENDSIDLVFADPPFNLKKLYKSEIDDDLSYQDYILWTEEWLDGCIRILKPGGSLFVWNIPRWNSVFAEYLNRRLSFRHWIAVSIKYSLPIQGRLYPSHYSLIYYVKGSRPNTFHPDRLPMKVCPKCSTDLVDYGGYKNKMNPMGVNISDVWDDIPPVRHNKYKKRKEANELSIKLLDRIIEMSSNPGDLVFDPFGGSGTTYVVSELKERRWIGVELGPIDGIVERFEMIHQDKDHLDSIRSKCNFLFTPEVKAKRQQTNLWTDEDFE